MIRIEPLALHPQHVIALVQMLHAEWGALNNWSDPDKLRASIENRMTTVKAPMAFIALAGDRLVGSASLKVNELPEYPDKLFWIGDVIIAPDQRGRGIGTAIMRAIVRHAATLGISDLYLYTPDQEQYYRKLGWNTVSRSDANGEDNVVMHYGC